MITLDTIREELGKRLEEDVNRRQVEVRADTLDEALADAAVQLEVRISQVEYEILEKGFSGVAKMGKRPWHIRAYPSSSVKKSIHQGESDDISGESGFDSENIPVDMDGVFYIRYFYDGLYLKATAPVGAGNPVSLKEVMTSIRARETTYLDEDKVKKIIAAQEGIYEQIGRYDHVPSGDAVMTIEISSDEMEVSIVVSQPGHGGAEIAEEQIQQNLDFQGVVIGIDAERITTFVDNPVYGIPYIVARGIVPVDGRDAYIAYNFETDQTKIRLKEAADGKVDFKELNLIQNVVEGQPLAQKIPAERGKAGKTIKGKYLEAKNGKDINMPIGKNVTIDADGQTILAAINGQVLLVNNKINVEPILQIDGDVSIKTGNITFLGTVIVTGNVEDGFSLKASGNVEVYGTVGKAVIDAEGDIIVTQGITGRGDGYIKTGRSLWAKFIENTRVDAEDLIIVSDGIINSQVTSNKKILVQGKRAAIIGGHLFATEEIHAKSIGSSAGGSDTVLEVGFDPRSKKRLDDLVATQTALVKELEEVELNIQTLENMKKQMRKPLSPERQENLSKLLDRQAEIREQSEKMSEEITQIQEYLRNLKIVGKVSASTKVFAGVKVYIRDVKEEVRNDTKAVTFFLENGFIRYGKYEGPNEDMKRMPDGYAK